MTIVLPRFLYLIYLFPREPVGTINPFLFTFWMFLPAFQLAFYFAVGFRMIQILRKCVNSARGLIIPPYEKQPPEKELPRERGYARSRKLSNIRRWFAISFSSVIILNVAYNLHFQWNPEAVANIIRVVPSDIVLSVLSLILVFPVDQFGSSISGDMTPIVLISSILLIWVPAIPLAVWYLNLNSYLYEIIRNRLFSTIDAAFWNS